MEEIEAGKWPTRAAAAKHYGVSAARISQVVVDEKKKAQRKKAEEPSPDARDSSVGDSLVASRPGDTSRAPPVAAGVENIRVSEAPVLAEAKELQSMSQGATEKPSFHSTETPTGFSTGEKPVKTRIDFSDMASVVIGVVGGRLSSVGYSQFTAEEIDNVKAKAAKLSEFTPEVDSRTAAAVEFLSAVLAPVVKRAVTEKATIVKKPKEAEPEPKKESSQETTGLGLNKSIQNLRNAAGIYVDNPTLTMDEKIALAEKRRAAMGTEP